MNNSFLRVALRQNAIFIPKAKTAKSDHGMTEVNSLFIRNIRGLGYTVSEELLYALNETTPTYQLEIYNTLKDILGVNLNWAPLVKGWDTPTGENIWDHLITWFVNEMGTKGEYDTVLQCGHIIPENTFPIERYNGCPFCGTPFELAKIENFGQGSKLKVLTLWTEENIESFFNDLLASRTALDATQVDSLKLMIKYLPLPSVEIEMKETLVLVVEHLTEQGEGEKAAALFTNPVDIMRYLWYKKTGFLQLVEPRTIVQRKSKNRGHMFAPADEKEKGASDAKSELKLKYTRKECRMVATWINNLPLKAEKSCEMMHAKRRMWVRFIRALRLTEYAKKEGFENLKKLIDIFYKQEYTVYEGKLQTARLKTDMNTAFQLLQQRPGLFARSLFANMLWFGAEETLSAFDEIVNEVPSRLIFTINMYAQNYFDPNFTRVVKPLGGNAKRVESNRLLSLHNEDQLQEMVKKVEEMTLQTAFNRYSTVETKSKTIHIAPELFNIPLAIGDRSETVQDLSGALQGQRFKIEGNTVRLFMQWGKDLPAQHMDMDLSCHIAFESYDQENVVCSYYNLSPEGALHSGDIRAIPDKTGTAEYIEIDIDKLRKLKAKYVTFTCNAYSVGDLEPNMVIGWMNSEHKMKISEKTGVAYDPSTVQHQVRVRDSLAKGLVFGVLDLASKEITWLEMPFGGQNIASLDSKSVEGILEKLKSKTSIGQLLEIKAKAQNLETVDDIANADEIYDIAWAMNTAAVTQLLID